MAIEKIKQNRYDILILDYILNDNLDGGKVAKIVREFSNIYIILLTGHKDVAPPIETLRTLEIQSYCEKSHNFDNVLLQIEASMKSIKYFRDILFNFTFKDMLVMLRQVYGYSQEDIAKLIGVHRSTIIDYENGSASPSHANLIKLSSLLNVSMDTLSGRFIYT